MRLCVRSLCVTWVVVGAVGCGPIGASSDAGLDPPDAAVLDAGAADSGALDGGADDAGAFDAGAFDAGTLDAGTLDAGTLDAGTPDAGTPDAGTPDAGTPDAGPNPSHPGWARYTIAVGSHPATVALNGASASPLAGLSTAPARAYQFIFNPSAMYVLVNPVQPNDQFDWNKLPGLSDCGQFDLAQDGWMFGWRWRLDLVPPVLELAHYANNAGVHLSPAQGLVTLDAADLMAEEPLRYELSIGGPNNSRYRFRISGTMRGRLIDVSGEHPRRCAGDSPSSFKWASGFYFGGTSTAPQVITGYVREPG